MGSTGVHVDLGEYLDKPQCECLNASDKHTLKHAMEPDRSLFLQSDCDEQLLIHLTFNQLVRVHSLIIEAPEEERFKAPSSIRVFVNKPTLDFDAAEQEKPVQELTLNAGHAAGDAIELRYVLFQKVRDLSIFVPGNLGGLDETAIQRLKLIGTPVPQEGAKPSESQQKAATAGDWLNPK